MCTSLSHTDDAKLINCVFVDVHAAGLEGHRLNDEASFNNAFTTFVGGGLARTADGSHSRSHTLVILTVLQRVNRQVPQFQRTPANYACVEMRAELG